MWPEWRSRIPGSTLRISATAPEVVQLDRALEVVEALIRVGDRAPDRHPRVVHQDVHAAVLGQHLLGHRPDRVGVGEVARVDVRLSPDLLDLRLDRLELLAGARDQKDPGAVHAHADRGRLADAGRGARDEHRLALHARCEASGRGKGWAWAGCAARRSPPSRRRGADRLSTAWPWARDSTVCGELRTQPTASRRASGLEAARPGVHRLRRPARVANRHLPAVVRRLALVLGVVRARMRWCRSGSGRSRRRRHGDSSGTRP